jgi:hypothetical protein
MASQYDEFAGRAITGSIEHDVHDAWTALLADALETTPDRVVARLLGSASGERSQSSALQRALAGSFACPESLRGGGAHDDIATIDVLRRVRLLHFDYEHTPSRDHVRALEDCQRLLRSGDAAEAEKLWRRLTGIADEKRTGGSIDLAQLLDKLRGEFNLRDHPDYRRDWEVLNRASWACQLSAGDLAQPRRS